MRHWRRALAGSLLSLLATSPGAAASSPAPYDEPFRPQIHFSPPAHWMNDPNGMVYADGQYHLMYQYHPGSTTWGPMHWGHAVSTDLLHWQHLPVALYPDADGTIFSGSAVLDDQNTSHLGAAGRGPLVALYTRHNARLEHAGRSDFQSQGLAFSVDEGRSWQKLAGNPVLANPGLRNFRDPKVFWHARTRRWIMALAAGDHVRFYSSADLRHWRAESEFGRDQGAHGGVWECPDLVEMPVEGRPDRKFVLIVSVIDGAPNGGSGTQYFTGDFDGHTFRPDSPPTVPRTPAWLDWGTDDYAGVTWSGTPGAHPLFIGWMSNWRYAPRVPTDPWRGVMTVPRELSLVPVAEGLELRSAPVAQLAELRAGGRTLEPVTLREARELAGNLLTSADAFELLLELDTLQAQHVTLTFRNDAHEQVDLRIERPQQRYELDRSHSGFIDLGAGFEDVQRAPQPQPGTRTTLRILVDRSSIEVFINDGQTVMTALDFPSQPLRHVVLSADAPVALSGGALYPLRSVWHTP